MFVKYFEHCLEEINSIHTVTIWIQNVQSTRYCEHKHDFERYPSSSTLVWRAFILWLYGGPIIMSLMLWIFADLIEIIAYSTDVKKMPCD